MSDLGFEFFAGGIEDGILEVLEGVMKPLGVRTFSTYSGELDSDNLKKAINDITPNFPMIMVSYTDGTDKPMPATSSIPGRSLHFRHDCSFAVICVVDDARGETARRRGKPIGSKKIGVYSMMAAVRNTLSGLQLITMVEEERVILTNGLLTPVANEFIARVPQMTAYAVIFETYFQWSSPKRGEAGTQVQQLVLGVESLNSPSEANSNTPGVQTI